MLSTPRLAPWFFILLLVGIGGGMWLFKYKYGEPISHGSRWAPDVSLNIVDGRTLRLAQLRGHPVLVSFWATSCASCVEEIPELKALYRTLAPQGLEIVAVAMPYDPPNRVLEMRRRLQIPWPVALDLDGSVMHAFGDVAATPASFLIDAQGRIVARHLGRHDMAQLRQQIGQLLRQQETG